MIALNPALDWRVEAAAHLNGTRLLDAAEMPPELTGLERVVIQCGTEVIDRWFWADEAPWWKADAYRPVPTALEEHCPDCGFALVAAVPPEDDLPSCAECGGYGW